MADPYEEERRALFLAPVDALLMSLDRVRDELVQIKQTESPDECAAMFERAQDLLFDTLLLCRPMARMETRDGRLAFLWSTSKDGHDAAHYWIVCRSDGSHKFGTAANRADCEARAMQELAVP